MITKFTQKIANMEINTYFITQNYENPDIEKLSN